MSGNEFIPEISEPPGTKYISEILNNFLNKLNFEANAE